jgi:hypothetical protein
MKKILLPVLVILFVSGFCSNSDAKIGYGPIVVDDSSLIEEKTFEFQGSLSYASLTFEPGPLPGESVTPGPGGEMPDPLEIDVTYMSLTGSLDYGLSEKFEIGVSLTNVSRKSDDEDNETGSGEERIPEVSGMNDIAAKCKYMLSEEFALTGAVLLPTGDEDVVGADNDMDLIGGIICSVDLNGLFVHGNLSITKWGDDDASEDTTTGYGIAAELPVEDMNITGELTGSTLENMSDKTPLDLFIGMRIKTSDVFELFGLMGIGLSEGSDLGEYGLSYGGGIRWALGD